MRANFGILMARKKGLLPLFHWRLDAKLKSGFAASRAERLRLSGELLSISLLRLSLRRILERTVR